jgi:hypothetical protein
LIDVYLEEQNKEENLAEQDTYSLINKIRIVIEALIFSWFIPQGRRWKRQRK